MSDDISSNLALIKFLNKIFDTNEDFATKHSEAFFDSFRDVQTPQMTIVKCSDSRVQMESFDRTPQNGVFAIRNIGNQIATCEGSVDFGVRVLKTPILFIIGHSGCGAVEAVLNNVTDVPEAVSKELNTISLSKGNMHDAIVENIKNQVDFAMQKYHDLITEDKLTVVGAVYDFKNDFGFGKGKIVFTHINHIDSADKVKEAFGDKISNICFYKK